MPKRRGQGDGGVYQRCDARYGCPPREPSAGGEMVRPKHRCKGPWCASLELGVDGGKRKRKVLTARSRSEVAEKLRHATDQLGRTGVVATHIPRLDAYLEQWLDEVEVHRTTPTTLRAHRSQVKEHVNPYLGRERLDRLNADHILAWHTRLRAKPAKRGGGNLKESTVLRVHSVLSRALNDAIPRGYLPHGNPAKKVDRPGTGVQRIDELDAAQAAALLRHVAADPLGSRWAFALLTGQRQGETLGMRWSHLDLDAGLADVSWQLQRFDYRHGCGDEPTCGRRFAGDCPDRELDVRDTYEYEQVDGALCLARPKGDRARIIPVIASLAAWLRQHRDEHGGDGFVWTRDGGRPLDLRQDYQAWVDLLAACELPRVRLHSTRHTTVSLLYALGISEPVVMQVVGHSVVSTTRRYRNEDLTRARAALAQLGDALHLELPELCRPLALPASTGNGSQQ